MIEFAVRRPIAVFMICAGLTVLGLIAAKRIPVQLMPNIQTPEFTIVTQLNGATPEEIETLVTAPLERSVSTVGGLERTTSSSDRERSEIHLTFKSSIDYLETASSLREHLDGAALPEGATRPKILRFQANAAPVIRLAIKPKDNSMTPLETAQLLQDVLLRKIEGIDGVAVASLSGAPERRIQITVDPVALQSYGIALASVPGVIQEHNRSFPAGEIQFDGMRTSVKLGQGLQSLDDLGHLVMKRDASKIVYLADIARIQQITDKPSIRSHLQGEDSFVIDVRKESEANSVRVANLVKSAIDEFLTEHSDQVQGWILFDQGHQIEIAIDNVSESVFHGGVLAALVIFVLMQNWWPTFVVSISMPISILITFILMYFTGISFNLMSLAGLALGVGMLVDNSTVVLDNIHLYQSRMDDPQSAALWGTRTVVGAITGSTLSMMAVFGPLAFVDGVMGQMFRDVSATVCYSLAASLFSAVFIIPMLSSLQIKSTTSSSPRKVSQIHSWQTAWLGYSSGVYFNGGALGFVRDYWRKNLLVFRISILWFASQIRGLCAPLANFLGRKLSQIWNLTVQRFLNSVAILITGLEESLKRIIPEVISNSGPTLRWAVGLTMVGCLFFWWRGAELFPDESVDRLVYALEFTPGQSIETTEKKISEIERQLLATPNVISMASTIGDSGAHLAKLSFQVVEKQSQAIHLQIAKVLSQQPDLIFTRAKESVLGDSKPVQIEIYNEDLGQLKVQTAMALDKLKEIDGLVDLESNIKSDLSEIVVEFSKEKLGWFGADASGFVSVLRPMLMGQTAGLLQLHGEDFPIHVRVPANYFDSVGKVRDVSLPMDENHSLYLSQVSDIHEHKILASIKRVNRKRMAVVAANLNHADLDSISKKIQMSLDSGPEQDRVNWKMGGQGEERERSQKSMLIAIGLSIFLIYLMLAGQFENLIQPVIILCAVPLCISGVALFLLLFNLNISALVFVGLVILVGVSVNTSIVMVDFANQLVAQGRPLSEAIAEATVRRMRPILVTTLSGILGLVPMALAMGQGAAMQQPLAVTMIGGHVSSTVLTMLVVPIIYARLARGATHERAE